MAEGRSTPHRSYRASGEAPPWRLGVAVAALAACGAAPAYGAACDDLRSLQLPHTTINSAQSIAAGSYQPPGSATAFTNLPAFCRVTATVSPVPDSSIGIEVWLPSESTWNRKFLQAGTHGFAGTFFWGEMVAPLQRGYATAITDNGHTGNPANGFDVSWAFGHPEKVTDLAWRGVHELAVKSKLIIRAYYQKPARYSYFNGCSSGGREGMKAAQMFPRDFNGIIAGSGFTYWTRSATQLLVYEKNVINAGIQGDRGAAIMNLVQNATNAACDGADGVVDGIINDPRSCEFDASTLVCKAGQDPNSCITSTQAAAINANTTTLRDPVTGKYIFSNMTHGSETEQVRRGWLRPGANNAILLGLSNYQLAFNDPKWDGSTFNLHADYPLLDYALEDMNALDTDMRPFRRAGGKLIQYHGWADPSSTPEFQVKLYNEVIDETGRGDVKRVQDFYRLFMLPGVGHCGGGPGPDNIGAENQTPVSNDPEHDIVTALEQWVEEDIPPRKLIATKFVNNNPAQGIAMQRPVCPYPSEAVYRGTGNPAAASSFYCSRVPALDLRGRDASQGE